MHFNFLIKKELEFWIQKHLVNFDLRKNFFLAKWLFLFSFLEESTWNEKVYVQG